MAHVDINTVRQCLCGRSKPVVADDVYEIVCSGCGTVLDSVVEEYTGNHSVLDHYLPSENIGGVAKTRRARGMSRNVDSAGLSVTHNVHVCCTKLGLPLVVTERALSLFTKSRALLGKGRIASSFSAAVLFLACREHSVARTMAEICKTMNAREKLTRTMYKQLLQIHEVALPIPTPESFVPRLISKLGLSEKTARKAFKILNVMNDAGTTAGKMPKALAAYAILMTMYNSSDLEPMHNSSALEIIYETISNASGVAGSTLKTYVKHGLFDSNKPL